MYPIKEVPVEAEALTDWLYQRFVEKEELLAHFYDTGLSRRVKSEISSMLCQRNINYNDAAAVVQIFSVVLKRLKLYLIKTYM